MGHVSCYWCQDSRDSRDCSVKKRTTKMTMTTHSCFRSAALLSARQSFAPFTRKAPQSRRITPSTCFHHPPSWFPHLKPETLLVQVRLSCCPIVHAGRQSSLQKAPDAGCWAVLIFLCSHAVMLHFRRIALLIALLIPLLWIAQRLSQVRSLDSIGLVALCCRKQPAAALYRDVQYDLCFTGTDGNQHQRQ